MAQWQLLLQVPPFAFASAFTKASLTFCSVAGCVVVGAAPSDVLDTAVLGPALRAALAEDLVSRFGATDCSSIPLPLELAAGRSSIGLTCT